MLKDVDALPLKSSWMYRSLEVLANSDGSGSVREVDLFYRDPIELVKELIGNPEFNHPNIMAYEPERVLIEGKDGELVQEFGEAKSGKWWYDLQVSIRRCQPVHNG